VEAYLQEQGESGGVRVSVLKGRANYLCLERWAQVRQDTAPRTEAEVRLFSRVAAWLPATETGDLAELYMTSQERPAWSQISAGDTDCLQRRCAYVRDGSCFLLRARQQAAASHVVIVNHSLLLANAARDDQVLPPFRHLVVDEAHRLEDVATQHFSATLGMRELRDLVDGLGQGDRHGEPGLAQRAQGLGSGSDAALLSPAAGLAPLAGQIEVAVSGTRGHVSEFTAALRRFIDESVEDGAPRREISITAARRGQASWEEVETAAVPLDLGLRVIGERLGTLVETLGALEAEGTWQAEPLRHEATRAASALEVARDTLRRTVLRADRDDIAWVTRAEGDIRLGRVPLDMAPHLAEELWEGRESVFATSATLSAAGSFDFALRRLGLDEADTLTVESPYDYRSAVVTLLAEELPDPGMPSYETSLQQTISEVVRASAGRTLVLFTSHQAVRSTAAALRELLAEDDINVFAQGIDGSPQRLLRLLNERPRSVILGTAAFWEGVDVPGEALSQLVIARLPFPVPTDPIYEARSNEFDDPFGEYALPQAVLRFRQGFGRLIRGSTDRGVSWCWTAASCDARTARRSWTACRTARCACCAPRTSRSTWGDGSGERSERCPAAGHPVTGHPVTGRLGTRPRHHAGAQRRGAGGGPAVARAGADGRRGPLGGAGDARGGGAGRVVRGARGGRGRRGRPRAARLARARSDDASGGGDGARTPGARGVDEGGARGGAAAGGGGLPAVVRARTPDERARVVLHAALRLHAGAGCAAAGRSG
jgi:Rad3-related DNA helicase